MLADPTGKQARVFAGLLVAALVAAPFVLTGGLLPAVVGALVYVPAVFGLVLLTGRTGQLSLGHGPLVGLGAYTYVVATEQLSLPSLGAVIVAVVITTLVAALTAPILRLNGLTFALATLAIGFVLVQLFTNLASLTGGPSGLTNTGVRPDFFAIGPVVFASLTARYFLVLGAGVIAFVICRNVLMSRLGRSLDFIATDEPAAMTLGIDVQALKVRVWLLAGALAGLSGAMHIAYSRFAAPSQFGLLLSGLLVGAVVVGGTRSLLGGAAVLVIFFTIVELVPWLETSASLLTGLIIVTVMLVREGAIRVPGRRSQPVTIVPEHVPPVVATPAPSTVRSSDGAFLRAVGVSVSFGGLKAVQAVDLVVAPGRIVGLIGPNGAGKTTLINALTGMVTTDGGTIHLGDRDISSSTPVQRVELGVRRTHQNIRVVPDRSVRENVELGGHSLGSAGFVSAMLALPEQRRERRTIEDASNEQLSRWGLLDVADALAGKLPAGTRRLLEVARACVTEPDVLFLDEPAAGLNDVEADRLAVLIRETADAGAAILLVEHDLPLVMKLCDEIVVLDQGAVIAVGPPDEVLANSRVHEIYIGPTHVQG